MLVIKKGVIMKAKFVLILILSTFGFARIDVVTTIMPQASLIKSIGGENVNVVAMVPAGASPHSYEPKPSQMLAISKAKIYFAIGVEFEHAWLPRFHSQNKNMIIIDNAKGIKKIAMTEHHDEHEKHHQHTNELDPHVWTSPNNLKVMATNIKNTLIAVDGKNRALYTENYTKLINSINQTDAQIKSILKATPRGSKFMIFHPAWGYFAAQYGLIQIPIELEGKEPKAKDLISLIKTVKKEHIRAIFVAPEFSSKSASQISESTHIPVVKVSNLGYDWKAYLLTFTKAIANQK
jgi:zinc transport system substrate-binding protein